MKIGEKFEYRDGVLGHVTTHDFNPILDSAAQLRANAPAKMGENAHVARIPYRLWLEWAKEAGVNPSDHHAMEEVLMRKVNDPDFSLFRVRGGRF